MQPQIRVQFRWKITSNGIKYVDIRYTDSRLDDPSIMKNIDY